MEDIACVHICTPNFLHYSQSKALLLAGKHVVCEKPLATKIEEAEELVQDLFESLGAKFKAAAGANAWQVKD